jgi:indolepyruvate ferredoxin oxidoreductase, beta subunit
MSAVRRPLSMWKDESKNILICGVGGQGIVLLGKILGEYYLKEGFELKISDIVGLGQRGGSVVCHFRVSHSPLMSPLIRIGEVDIIISFEATETLRNLHYLKDNGIVLTSTFEISSPTVNAELEEDIIGVKIDIIKESCKNVFIMDVYNAKDSNLTINTAMLGFYASIMELDHEEVIDIMKQNIKDEFIEKNISAYNRGKEIRGEQHVLDK